MTSKLKQSIAVQRQIPEHIRNNYPVFVEFIKLYYDFLQQTQAQDLESIRDIDTTLEEFIDNFKSELSSNFPIDMAQDKPLLLKHLREFYLSRGSEDSFKFLFRALFNKEAELYYPSQQILRVSDGRWTQDVSIFVKLTGSTTTLFPVNGQFITITTSRKTLTTFVENVTEYTTDTFEIFIQRDYINEITVGSTILCTSGSNTYTGIILQCPTKIDIFKAGSGFKVGDLYALKTSIGRGCVIKITKTGSLGEIKAIQVISFGLDYETKFYSYLSSKDIVAFEYVHPARLNNTTPPNPSYTERTGGFIEYGFASKQTYMYYDQTINVANESQGVDRFYADPSYVGEIQAQFYDDQTEKVIDDSLAIIEISLGAVAKYPGYYMTANGFISDEMYIHDGEYYQAFSYVVKVEEELRRYADILKTLLHPAGMKMFAEYNIFTELKLSFVQPLIAQLLQFSDTILLSDNSSIYSSYVIEKTGIYTEVNINGITYQIPEYSFTPAVGATLSFTSQGKVSLLAFKFLGHAITDIFDSNNYSMNKGLSDTPSASDTASDAFKKAVSKLIDPDTASALDTASDAFKKATSKLINDTPSASDTASDAFKKAVSKLIDPDTASALDTASDAFKKATSKLIDPDTTSASDTAADAFKKDTSKLIDPDTTSASDTAADAFKKDTSKLIDPDTTSAGDLPTLEPKLVYADSTNSTSDLPVLHPKPVYADTNSASDTASDAFKKDISKLIDPDTTRAGDLPTLEPKLVYADSTNSTTDLPVLHPKPVYSDSTNSTTDLPVLHPKPVYSDSTNSTTDLPALEPKPVYADAIDNIIDLIQLSRNIPVNDSTNSTTDLPVLHPKPAYNDSTNSTTDLPVLHPKPAYNDSTNSTTDLPVLHPKPVYADAINNIIDLIQLSRNIPVDGDSVSASDVAADAFKSIIDKKLNDIAEALDITSINVNQQYPDAINISNTGEIILSPYNSESYFEVYSGFQPSITIS